MKIKLQIIILLFSISCHALENIQSKTQDSIKREILILKSQVNELKSKQNDLESKQEYQNRQIDSQTGMIDTAFDGVSAEIGGASNYISIFGTGLAIFTIFLSIYVSRMEKSVKRMRDDSETLFHTNLQIKESVESLSEKITNDSKGLYKIIRNEESNHIIDRLISVPEDIGNLYNNLATRDLEPEHFLKLKEAYMQVRLDPAFNSNYLTLLTQHFSGLSILDEDIKDDFTKSLKHSFEHSFKNDLVKSSFDFFKALANYDFSKFVMEINSFANELSINDFGTNEQIYFAINQAVENRGSKFKLYNIIEKSPTKLIFRKMFGKLIVDYNYEDLTVAEQTSIDEIKNLK